MVWFWNQGTTPGPTQQPPPTSCGSPQWAGDGYCDDDNNNAGCQYDQGDCCNNKQPGWDNFCSVCECLESSTPTSSSSTTSTTPAVISTTTIKPNECGGLLSGPSGSFSSPGWPNQYPTFKQCTWEITCEKTQVVLINFSDFSLEWNPNGSCR